MSGDRDRERDHPMMAFFRLLAARDHGDAELKNRALGDLSRHGFEVRVTTDPRDDETRQRDPKPVASA